MQISQEVPVSGRLLECYGEDLTELSYLYETPREVNIKTRFLNSNGRSDNVPFFFADSSPSDESEESARRVVLLSSESSGSAERIADLYADAILFGGWCFAVQAVGYEIWMRDKKFMESR